MIISDDMADRFARALIVHAGQRTKAAEACGYQSGIPARSAGSDLARNPKVLERLQPLVSAHLQSLTPKAIATLGKLLDHKSGYIRLEAAKDILDRNGVGTSQAPMQSQPFLIRINLGHTSTSEGNTPVLEHSSLQAQDSRSRPGGRKPEKIEVTSTPAHDFSSEVKSLTPTHDFSPEALSPGGTIDSGAAKPVEEEKAVPKGSYDFEL